MMTRHLVSTFSTSTSHTVWGLGVVRTQKIDACFLIFSYRTTKTDEENKMNDTLAHTCCPSNPKLDDMKNMLGVNCCKEI